MSRPTTLALLIALAARPALASDPSAASAPVNAAEPDVEPLTPVEVGPPPREQGFVAFGGIGPGFFSMSPEGTRGSRHFTGATLSIMAFIGGHVGERVALGGGYLRDQVYALSAKDDVPSPYTPDMHGIGFTLNTFAVFGDVMLTLANPELHLFAFAGPANLSVDGRPSEVSDAHPGGYALGGGITGEFRVGRQFTLGVAARFTHAPLTVHEVAAEPATDVPVLLPALLVTARFD